LISQGLNQPEKEGFQVGHLPLLPRKKCFKILIRLRLLLITILDQKVFLI